MTCLTCHVYDTLQNNLHIIHLSILPLPDCSDCNCLNPQHPAFGPGESEMLNSGSEKNNILFWYILSFTSTVFQYKDTFQISLRFPKAKEGLYKSYKGYYFCWMKVPKEAKQEYHPKANSWILTKSTTRMWEERSIIHWKFCLGFTGPIFPNPSLKSPTKDSRKPDLSLLYLHKGVTEVLEPCNWKEERSECWTGRRKFIRQKVNINLRPNTQIFTFFFSGFPTFARAMNLVACCAFSCRTTWFLQYI